MMSPLQKRFIHRGTKNQLGRAFAQARLEGLALLVIIISLRSVSADSPPGDPNISASGISPKITFITINHLGESDQQAALRDGQLLTHHRKTDPFGLAIRGPFKGLNLMVEAPALTSVQPVIASPIAAPAAVTLNEPTVESAVQALAIGGVNLASREMLIGSRAVHEGDLLMLASGVRRFIVWVQSVEVNGVLFSDVDLQKHIFKSFGTGPKELPGKSAWGISDLHQVLNEDQSQ